MAAIVTKVDSPGPDGKLWCICFPHDQDAVPGAEEDRPLTLLETGPIEHQDLNGPKPNYPCWRVAKR